ncbi:MAG: hypothetical protein AAF320_00745, partial [Myxococcota bacterium]
KDAKPYLKLARRPSWLYRAHHLGFNFVLAAATRPSWGGHSFELLLSPACPFCGCIDTWVSACWEHLFLHCRRARVIARHYGLEWVLDLALASLVSFTLYVASGPFALLTAKWLAVLHLDLAVPPDSPAQTAQWVTYYVAKEQDNDVLVYELQGQDDDLYGPIGLAAFNAQTSP